MNDSISYLSLCYIAVLIIPTLFMNKKLGIGLNKKILISLTRMIVQLSLVGVYLQYMFQLNNPFVNIAYVLLMVVVATLSALNSAKFSVKLLFTPLFFSMLIPDLFMVLFFNTVVLGLPNPLDARYLITINGMLLGNILNNDVVGMQNFYRGVKNNKNGINYSLALGATRLQAIRPYINSGIVASISPNIASMATMGLVSLPGMMTGQILGGSLPFEAILYQIGIMFAIYVTRYFSIYLGIMLSQKRMFDDKDNLV